MGGLIVREAIQKTYPELSGGLARISHSE
jgi:hypothetical protein